MLCPISWEGIAKQILLLWAQKLVPLSEIYMCVYVCVCVCV